MSATRQRRGSDLSDKVAMFNKKCAEHHEKQLSNPFSDIERPEGYQIAKLDINDPNYGRYEPTTPFYRLSRWSRYHYFKPAGLMDQSIRAEPSVAINCCIR